jgi:hypothetical protein
VRFLTLILMALIALRLLVPPGICLCKLSSPTSRLLCKALGSEPAPVPVEPDDQHHDEGCPAGVLSEGMGVVPAAPVLFEASCTALLNLPPADVAAAGEPLAVEIAFPASPQPPLFVSHCALRC